MIDHAPAPSPTFRDLLGQQGAADDGDERDQEPGRGTDRQADPDRVTLDRGARLLDAVRPVHRLDNGHGPARRGPQGQKRTDRRDARLLLADDPLEFGLDARCELGRKVVADGLHDPLRRISIPTHEAINEPSAARKMPKGKTAKSHRYASSAAMPDASSS